ncbi:MAG: Hpt domain-containing protein [Gammaproteobacteria bacterium]|nr:Hpt domain-containing protein [Gammaproteobacteria bacterium]
MDLNHLPIIDWELATKLAGNKKELAEELLCLLLKTLPDDRATIKQLYIEQNYAELLRRVHKLHGALCYCGLPRLKTIVARLETQLKSDIIDSLPPILDQLDVEIKLLLEHRPT